MCAVVLGCAAVVLVFLWCQTTTEKNESWAEAKEPRAAWRRISRNRSFRRREVAAMLLLPRWLGVGSSHVRFNDVVWTQDPVVHDEARLAGHWAFCEEFSRTKR